ncbi:MAG: Ig-like domain-containing protein [Bacilli bacterium]|jgi:uncharacterized protein YjdB
MKIKLNNIIILLAGLLTIPAALSVSLGQNMSETSAAVTTIITTRSTQTYIDNYYSTISSSLSGNALKASLELLLQGERNNSFSYGSLQSSAFPYTDVDPTRPNGGYIVSFYSGTPVSGYSGMNKEHTWPESHGGDRIQNDPHVIRPTLTSENSSRGNQYYAEESSNGWDPDTFGNEKYRGIAARVAFYGATIGHTEGLILEDVGRGQGGGTGNKMGKLGDLLKWNLEYPIDQSEIIRNETLDLSLNYNRNPFIDDVSFACRIWGDATANTRSVCSQSSAPLESLSLSPSNATLNVGATQNVTVTAQPTGASTSVTWNSSNQAIATVANGVVTARGEGQATITATSTDNTSITATMTITVNPPLPPTSLTINPSTLSVTVGNTSQLAVTSSPSGTSNSVTWSTSNADTALVSQGTVAGIDVGTATITATSTIDSQIKATCQVAVTEPVPEDSISYSFTSKSWGANPTNWTSGKEGLDFKNSGVQVSTGATGAFGNSPTSFQNVKNVTVQYCTNGTSGVGKIYVYAVASSGAAAKSGTLIDSKSVTTTGGTTSRNLEFPYASSGLNGYIQIYVETTTNSLYINGTTITYGTDGTGVSPTEEANTWALDFLNQTALGCGNKNASQLESVWSSVANAYDDMSDAAKLLISSALPNADGTNVEHAVARYLNIVGKYDLAAFIDGVQVPSAQQSLMQIPEEKLIFLTIFLAIIFVACALIFTIVKKAKTN